MHKAQRRPLLSQPEAYPEHWHPLIRTLYATRISDPLQVEKRLGSLLPPDGIVAIEQAAARLQQAMTTGETILVYGDYDVDGASATALLVRVLRRSGAKVHYFIPNRWNHGYGLSIAGLTSLCELPRLLITVDNGIASHEAATWLAERQVDLIITDHHEAGAELPQACAVVNPKRAESDPALAHLSGVGVAFYLLLALRRLWQRTQGAAFPVDLTEYLDLVALGTVADVVPLDHNNRILVSHGLRQVHRQRGNLGIRALCAVANIAPQTLNAQDIGFALAPRLNAVGRLEDMSDGVAMLLSDDWRTAQEYAQSLDSLNRDRKALESEMTTRAETLVDPALPIAVAYQGDWHEGVIGIVAARLKARFARPAMVATDTDGGTLVKASLRSLRGVNICDLLVHAADALPTDVLRFGGHAMAAGLTVEKSAYPQLLSALCAAFQRHIGARAPQEPLYIDGELPSELLDVGWAKYLEQLEPWGTDLPPPLFCNRFTVGECRPLGARHTRLILRHPHTGRQFQAAWFFHLAEFVPGDRIEVTYQIQVNRFFGDERLNLLVTYADYCA